MTTGSSTSEQRTVLRVLLAARFGSATSNAALAFIESKLRRRTLVLALTSAECAVVRRALEERRAA